MRFAIVLVILGVTAFLAGCGQDAPQPPPPTQVAPLPPPAAAPPAPDDLAAATEMPVYRVESVMVSRVEDEPTSVLIQAAGAVYSAGWTNARLVPAATEIGDGQLLTFHLLATTPATPQDGVPPYSVEAQLRLEAVTQDVTSIRIISASNELMAVVGRP